MRQSTCFCMEDSINLMFHLLIGRAHWAACVCPCLFLACLCTAWKNNMRYVKNEWNGCQKCARHVRPVRQCERPRQKIESAFCIWKLSDWVAPKSEVMGGARPTYCTNCSSIGANDARFNSVSVITGCQQGSLLITDDITRKAQQGITIRISSIVFIPPPHIWCPC